MILIQFNYLQRHNFSISEVWFRFNVVMHFQEKEGGYSKSINDLMPV